MSTGEKVVFATFNRIIVKAIIVILQDYAYDLLASDKKLPNHSTVFGCCVKHISMTKTKMKPSLALAIVEYLQTKQEARKKKK